MGCASAAEKEGKCKSSQEDGELLASKKQSRKQCWSTCLIPRSLTKMKTYKGSFMNTHWLNRKIFDSNWRNLMPWFIILLGFLEQIWGSWYLTHTSSLSNSVFLGLRALNSHTVYLARVGCSYDLAMGMLKSSFIHHLSGIGSVLYQEVLMGGHNSADAEINPSSSMIALCNI